MIQNLPRMEYITIISIMVTMTVWDFVIGVLFGIVVSCEFTPFYSNVDDSPLYDRFLLCRSKLPTTEHPNVLHRRHRHFYRSPSCCSPRIHPRSVETDAHHPTPRLSLLWHHLPRRRHHPFVRGRTSILCLPSSLCRRRFLARRWCRPVGCGSICESAEVVGSQGRRARLLWCFEGGSRQGIALRRGVGAALCRAV